MAMSDTLVAPAVDVQQTPEEMLFQPYLLGPYELPHRIVMAPLTRSRARQPGNVPGPLNACYYAQRASAALIISEATQVSMLTPISALPAAGCEDAREARAQLEP